jgi:epoxyqueuosine reductase QueG
VAEANAKERDQVAREWAVAYVETNALIGRITDELARELRQWGVRAIAEPATHNYDPVTFVSRWSHKSVAVLTGIGSFGLHHLVITDAGCAGRFGSLVIDAELPVEGRSPIERCLYFHDGSCLECVMRCPAGALDPETGIDKQRCSDRCHQFSEQFKDLGRAGVCGKCTFGPCALESAVQ